jgi:hypothetical protein
MARHRADGARTATPPPPSTSTRTDLGALLPQQGVGAAHPSGPLPRVGRGARRPAPPVPPQVKASETSPLDLAAIALAAAGARRAGLPEVGTSPTGGTATAAVPRTAADLPADPSTGGTPRPAYPAAVPSALAPPTPSHAVPAVGRGRPGRRVPLPTRTAGALAFVGALAAGGVAVVGGSAMLGDDPTPPTGELRVSEAGTAAAAVAPAASSAERSTPRDADGGGRHRADRTGDTDHAQDSGGY